MKKQTQKSKFIIPIDPEVFNAFEAYFVEYKKFGYQTAINMLMSKDADNLHEMYASGFGAWLEFKKPEIFEDEKPKNKKRS